jgi:hypothetical protein
LFSLDDVRVITIPTVASILFGGALVVAYALWRVGADRALAGVGRFILRAVTFGRIRLASDSSQSTAMGIAAVTLLVIFVAFVVVAAYLQ